MDDARYRLRPFEADDYAAEAEVDTRLNPAMPITAEEARHWDDGVTGPTLTRRKFAVEDRDTGRLVGYGVFAHNPGSFHPRKFIVYVAVDPDHQGRGVGRVLAARLEEEAHEHRALCLWATVRADDIRSVRFMERAGFVTVSQHWSSILDVSKTTPSLDTGRAESLRGAGIRLTSAAAEGSDRTEVREKLYRLHIEAAADQPHVGEYSPVTYEQFLEFALDGPGTLTDGLLIAAHGPDYVGTTSLERLLAQPDTLAVGFTGVLRPYRRRGIATALKACAIEYARSHGFRYVRTFNNSLNRSIWSINERMGFERQKTWTMGERTLPPSASPDSVESGRDPASVS